MAYIARLPGPEAHLWDWQLQAACRGMASSSFFHPPNERGPARERRETLAKAVCVTCPVIRECLAHSLAVREAYGVWGGLSEDERSRLLGIRPDSAGRRQQQASTHQDVNAAVR